MGAQKKAFTIAAVVLSLLALVVLIVLFPCQELFINTRTFCGNEYEPIRIAFDHNEGAAAGIPALLVFAVTLAYVILTKRSLNELKQQRLDASRPVLVAEWMYEAEKGKKDKPIRLMIKNHGPGTILEGYTQIKCYTGHIVDNGVARGKAVWEWSYPMGSLQSGSFLRLNETWEEFSSGDIVADIIYRDIHNVYYSTKNKLSGERMTSVEVDILKQNQWDARREEILELIVLQEPNVDSKQPVA